MIPDRLSILQHRLQVAACASPLASASVTLIAASKGQGEAALEAALNAGVRDFGENRVQEALAKWPGLQRRYPDVRVHLIGPLQTNKVREAVGFFDAIHTVDRERLADALAREMQRQERAPACFVQVNTGEEPQKAGMMPAQVDALIRHCRAAGLPVTGLMCIPPMGQLPAPHFALLRSLALLHGLPHLSMGMSEDFETAVRLGATHVRIGRALFGER